MNKGTEKIIIFGSIALTLGAVVFLFTRIRKNKRVVVEGSFKGANCDELHAFQNTGSRIIGGMATKVREALEDMYAKGINPEVREVIVDMDANKMEVKWKAILAPSKDGKAWVGFTTRGSSGNASAYDRAVGKAQGQDFDSVLAKIRKDSNESNAEMKVVKDFLYNFNRNKDILGKCPTRQIFYKYTKPNQYPRKK
jgi:hypothetical protein